VNALRCPAPVTLSLSASVHRLHSFFTYANTLARNWLPDSHGLLRRKDGSKYWFACFTLPDGGQTQRSTKQTGRSAAQKVADTFERAATQKMSEGQIRRVIPTLFEQVSGQRLASSSVRSYVEQFLKLKERESSKATYLRYKQLLGQFCEQLGDRANLDINFVAVVDVSVMGLPSG